MVKNISPETLVIDFGKFNLLDIPPPHKCRKHSVSRQQNRKMTSVPTDLRSALVLYQKTLVEEDKALLIGNGLKLRILDENASYIHSINILNTPISPSDMLICEKPIRLNYRP